MAIPAPVAEGTAQSDSSSFVFGAQILINFVEGQFSQFCFSLLVIVVWFEFVFGLSLYVLWAMRSQKYLGYCERNPRA